MHDTFDDDSLLAGGKEDQVRAVDGLPQARSEIVSAPVGSGLLCDAGTESEQLVDERDGARDSEGERIESCAIIVTQANEMLRPIHDRMPAILDADHFDLWLDTKAPLAETKALLRPFPGVMTVFPVSSRVNAVRNDDPDCLAPIGPAIMSCHAARSSAYAAE